MSLDSTFLPQIRAIDERLRPIATRAIDINEPNWQAKLKNLSPLDEAGVRPEAQDLLWRLVEAYARGDDDSRSAIRSLFTRFSSFAWAATLTSPPHTVTGFREHLLHFSILDQGLDPRDATLWLDNLVQTARRAGVDVAPALEEVALLSSRDDRYSWGSTADWLLRRRG